MEYRLPDDPLFLFIYNAFDKPILTEVLHNIRASWLENKREIFVVYVRPIYAEMFENFSLLQKVAEGTSDRPFLAFRRAQKE